MAFINSFQGFLLLLIITFASNEVIAQSINDTNHSVHLELAGRTLIVASMNYEYSFKNSFSLGIGLGLINIDSGSITRSNSGVPETGRFIDISTSQMIYANYFLGKKKNKVFLTGGVTNFLILNRNRYPSETQRFSETNIEWNAGIGYQFLFQKSFLRLTAYCISLGEPSFLLPSYLPWFGISYGIKI